MLERYILRTAAGAFGLCLAALTGVIWITSAMRELDLVSNKGQTILVFLQMTLLSLPALVMIVAPVALFVAVVYALNKLNGDSELIVMSAAGLPPARIARPLLLLSAMVMGLVGFITLYAMPQSFRGMRDLITQIRADVVSKVVQEGRFTTLDKGITFHYREKGPGDTMLGMLIQDRRDPAKVSTYLAERGQIVEAAGGAYLVLDRGSVHRQGGGGKADPSKPDPAKPAKDGKPAAPASGENAIIAFDRYALDLDQFGQADDKVTYKPRERSTMELLSADTRQRSAAELSGAGREDVYTQLARGRFVAELHERFANPLYPLATFAIAFAALGAPRTTRQGRGLAIGAAVIGVVALRVAGFAAQSAVARQPAAWALIYAVPVLFTVGGLLVAARVAGLRPSWPGGARATKRAARPAPAAA